MIKVLKNIERSGIMSELQGNYSRDSSNLSITTQNSFLVEVENNEDIDLNVRTEINKRFNRSLVNATYKFPRMNNSPFPSISLQGKSSQRESLEVQKRKFVKVLRIVSHTPKPSLNQSLNVTYKIKGNIVDKEIRDRRERKVVSITPTPIGFGNKTRSKHGFPKIKKNRKRSPYLSLKNKSS